MMDKKRTYEPRIFEGRVMLPEEQERVSSAAPHVQTHGVRHQFHARADLRQVGRAGAQAAAERAAWVMLGSLILKHASASRPSGEWSDDDFDVLADGVVVGSIMKATAAPVGSPWLWTLALRAPRRSLTDARLRGDARGGDGGVRAGFWRRAEKLRAMCGARRLATTLLTLRGAFRITRTAPRACSGQLHLSPNTQAGASG